jgi:uncharacterized protein YggE
MNNSLRSMIVPRRDEIHLSGERLWLLFLAVMLFLSAGLTGASTAEEARRTIVVMAKDRFRYTDQARLSAGVVTQEQTAAARCQHPGMNTVFAALKRLA